jgi:hypothetical protein
MLLFKRLLVVMIGHHWETQEGLKRKGKKEGTAERKEGKEVRTVFKYI